MQESASHLAAQVMLTLKGCPEVAALVGLRKAFSTLCRETGCWRHSMEWVVSGSESVRSGEVRTEVETSRLIPFVAGIDRIIRCEVMADGGTQWADVAVDGLRLELGATVYLVAPTGTFEDGDSLRVEVSLYPGATGNGIEDIPLSLVDTLSDVAVPRASAWLAGQSGRPWADMEAKAILERDERNARRDLLRKLTMGFAEQPDRNIPHEMVEG